MRHSASNAARSALAFLCLLSLAGCFGDTRSHVVIEFGAYPDEFIGMDVEVDGKVVGKLKQMGEITRSGFPLDKGQHTVRVVSPRFNSEPRQVNAEFKTQKIMLILEIGESMSASGSAKPTLTLR
jgi:hypothetical protein